MKKTLPLNEVLLSLDSETGVIELQSDDSRLSRGSLKLSISTQTASYRALLELFEADGSSLANGVPLETLRIESTDPLKAAGEDPRTHIEIGRGVGDSPVVLDLSGNLLVAGSTGSGKSILLRNILCHGLTEPEVELRAIDLKQVELSGYAYRPQDRLVTTWEDMLLLLRDLSDELEEREDLESSPPLLDLFSTIYILIDEIAPLFDWASALGDALGDATLSEAREIRELLIRLAQVGPSRKIYLIAGTQAFDSVPSELRSAISARVLMGASSSYHVRGLFGRSSTYGAAYLIPRGRGLMGKLGGEQTLFQSYFLPYMAYRGIR